ncbi:MerR family transcriptional regulator [Nocardiopsis sp. MG754419]|uniref:MerR family transcriptional regulator n=1 Tax=Nocardiopsis sp. MG754419 TaxID=2259865 RepID=UPI001BAE4753|nr:MerR family transcriptional regulator [Nocardiopsis sp. MG754419]MBR8741008.1 MerR family transcriptional regulator [Nocardiopsis sp. MG754419]
MGWSTRQLAELAGTSLRTIRHYHDVGLLAEPDRRANGYKSYGVDHLVRVMRVRRLSDLGFSLARIAEMGEADAYPENDLMALDAELARTIERLQRVRTELALVLRKAPPTDLPPEMALAADEHAMSEADRGLMVVWSRVLGPDAIRPFSVALRDYAPEAVDEEFDALGAEADEETRADVATRLTARVRDLRKARPALDDPWRQAPEGGARAADTLRTAIRDLYNPAQRDVLARVAHALATEDHAEPEASGPL